MSSCLSERAPRAAGRAAPAWARCSPRSASASFGDAPIGERAVAIEAPPRARARPRRAPGRSPHAAWSAGRSGAACPAGTAASVRALAERGRARRASSSFERVAPMRARSSALGPPRRATGPARRTWRPLPVELDRLAHLSERGERVDANGTGARGAAASRRPSAQRSASASRTRSHSRSARVLGGQGSARGRRRGVGHPARFGRDRVGDAAGPARHRVLLLLEVAEDRARIDAEVARRLRAVAVVALERLQHVAALELLLGLLERHDRRLGAPGRGRGPPGRGAVWSQSTSAFLMRFSSCRMLPGQAYFLIAASAAGLKPLHRAGPARRRTCESSTLAMMSTSSPRSRSGGSQRLTTLRR